MALAEVSVGIYTLSKSVHIFKSWPDKKRKYHVLMTRNSDTLHPDTFKDYMQAPCGRLLVHVVLADLGMSGRYRDLRALRQPLWTTLKSNCKTQKTVVYRPSQDFKSRL